MSAWGRESTSVNRAAASAVSLRPIPASASKRYLKPMMPALECELHRPAKHSRFGRRAVARKGSHQVDAILVPAAARAGREDEKLAPVALNDVAVGIPLLANSRREDRISILRATRVRDAFHADGRHKGCVSPKREAAKDRQAEDCKVEAAGVSGGAAARGR